MDIKTLLIEALNRGASDLHLSAGLPPLLRVDGELLRTERAVLEHDDVQHMVYSVMSESQQRSFAVSMEVDFRIEMEGVAAFRVNAFHHGRGAAAAFRVIPRHLPSREQLGMGPVFERIASFQSGLVLVTGPTGSGKSTTLAALVDYINRTRHQHILTVEDPVEFVHDSRLCLISQRQVHRDTSSFEDALRVALREDPDIILVGELRDLETIRLALTAAETGHLVLATLHTSSAAKTVNRLVDVFPAGEKSVVRSMLSESLQAVVSQVLVKKTAGGRLAAFEIMLCTPAIRNLIREDKVAQIYSAIQTGSGFGMQTLDQHLRALQRSDPQVLVMKDEYQV